MIDTPAHAFDIGSHLLGHAWESARVQALVDGWAEREWIDPEALKQARADHRLSLVDRAQGIYLFFTDVDSYEARYGKPCSKGNLVLSRVSLLLHVGSPWTPYAGALPLGLRADDRAGDVLQRLGPPADLWRADAEVSKARWSSPEAEVDVSFERGTGRLRLVTMARPAVEPVSAVAVPSPEQLATQFGRSLDQLAADAAFAPFALGSKAREIAAYGEADCSRELGIELYFKPGATPSLSGVRYRADLDFQSSGYTGPLPWGLRMSDTMDVAMAKAALRPFKESLDGDDGYQLWRTALCDVHVLYSFLEDRIYRVTLLAPGCCG